VVTGNKEVIAKHGASLERIASANGVALEYSASVGGAVPAIELVTNLAARSDIDSIEGVLNGTCNYVLQRLAECGDFDEALFEAQKKGFAEADPTSDLSGRDSASKLAILVKHAFGITILPDDIPYRGIEGMDSETIREADARSRVIKLVAACRKTSEGIHAEVCPLAIPIDHPLAGACGEENRILVKPKVGEAVLVHGKGAGRWPTSLSVVADLLDLHRSGARGRRLSPLAVTAEVSS
jgi:homoserine dehydrogenase